MTDFSKAVIYGIYCKDKTVLEIYIGSTKDRNKREEYHKSDCNNENIENYNRKVYIFIRANGGWDNWIFKVIQEYPCENKIELVIREQYHYDLLNPALNTYRPYVSEEERKVYYKNWNAKNYKDIREEIAKKYQDNRDELIEKIKKYNKDNIEEINKRKKQKFTCECGKEYTHGNKARHLDTNIHKNFIKNQNK